MRFNPLTKRLFTDEGKLLKQLHCPYRQDWHTLTVGENAGSRRCTLCDHQIMDTALMDEPGVQKLLEENPDACLKVSLEQDNITVTLQ